MTDNAVHFKALPPGGGVPDLVGGLDITGSGYAEAEYVVAGAAQEYTPVALPGDGRFVVVPGGEAPFATRIHVRRPSDPSRFNGTVLVEWLNVSGGADGAADWS